MGSFTRDTCVAGAATGTARTTPAPREPARGARAHDEGAAV